MDSLYRERVKKVHDCELVDFKATRENLANFTATYDGLADATAQRLKTYNPVVTIGANRAMGQLMSAVVTCHMWEIPADRNASEDAESDLERLRLDYMTYHMLSVEFFTVVAKSQVRRHVALYSISPCRPAFHVAMSPCRRYVAVVFHVAMSPLCRRSISCRHVAVMSP